MSVAPATPVLETETPVDATGPDRRSRPVVALATLVVTAAVGWWWTVHEDGSAAGLRQRLSGAQMIVANLTTATLPLVVPHGAWRDVAGTPKPTASGRQERPLELYT
jgi:hypothetical protein